MVDVVTPEQVAQAKQDYDRARAVLLADQRATEWRAKQAALGKCFQCLEHGRDDTAWPVYVATISLDEATGQLRGWHFQNTPTGQIELAPDDDLQPGFLAERCTEISRSQFVTAFNELLTAIARYANKMPQS
jgi:hypothetical protein